MSRHSIVLIRAGVAGFLSDQSIGTDALNAMQSIPGVKDPRIVSESEKRVEITYDWGGKQKFWHTDEYLRKFGLESADEKRNTEGGGDVDTAE